MQLGESVCVCFEIVSEHCQSTLFQILCFDWEYCPFTSYPFLPIYWLNSRLSLYSFTYSFNQLFIHWLSDFFEFFFLIHNLPAWIMYFCITAHYLGIWQGLQYTFRTAWCIWSKLYSIYLYLMVDSVIASHLPLSKQILF